MNVEVFGLGNPIVDLFFNVKEDFLERLNLSKGTMHLIDRERKKELLKKLEGKRPEIEEGGSAPNTMVTLSLLGVKSAIAGKIGEDELGNKYLDIITSKNVKSHLKRGSSETGTSIILITPDGERTMNTFLGACREYSPDDLPVNIIEEAQIFYFTGYMWDTENQKAAALEGIKRARKADTKVVFDVSDPLVVERYRDDFLQIIEKYVDILFANAAEAKILTQKKELDGAIREIPRLCKLGIIKNGEKNSFIVNNGNIIKIPSLKTKVIDTTGAGDNYAAGFIYGLLRGYSLEKSGEIASFVASKTIEKIGAHVSENVIQLIKGTI